jgi:hypothetical protein
MKRKQNQFIIQSNYFIYRKYYMFRCRIINCTRCKNSQLVSYGNFSRIANCFKKIKRYSMGIYICSRYVHMFCGILVWETLLQRKGPAAGTSKHDTTLVGGQTEYKDSVKYSEQPSSYLPPEYHDSVTHSGYPELRRPNRYTNPVAQYPTPTPLPKKVGLILSRK